MKRAEWTFEMKAEQLAQAARDKIKHHTDRLEFWKGAQSKVMEEVKAKGLSVEVSLAGEGYASGSNIRGAASPQIMVDQVYQRQLSEAHAKISEHTRKVSEYEGWRQVLEANGGRTYPLNADDYLFFFGK